MKRIFGTPPRGGEQDDLKQLFWGVIRSWVNFLGDQFDYGQKFSGEKRNYEQPFREEKWILLSFGDGFETTFFLGSMGTLPAAEIWQWDFSFPDGGEWKGGLAS